LHGSLGVVAVATHNDPLCVTRDASLVLRTADVGLMVYVSRVDWTFDLHWSQTLSGGDVNKLAQRT
jgi:hypothetical protein